MTLFSDARLSLLLKTPVLRLLHPTLGIQLEFQGDKRSPAPESTPHESATIYESTYEGAHQIAEFMQPDTIETRTRQVHAHLQTELEIPFRAVGAYTPST